MSIFARASASLISFNHLTSQYITCHLVGSFLSTPKVPLCNESNSLDMLLPALPPLIAIGSISPISATVNADAYSVALIGSLESDHSSDHLRFLQHQDQIPSCLTPSFLSFFARSSEQTWSSSFISIN